MCLHNRFFYFPPIVCDRLSIGCGRPILQLPSKRLSLRKPTHAPYAGDVFAIAVRCLASPPFDFYGADWCGDCRRAKAALDRFGVAYNLHDIEHEDGAAEKAIAISGQQHIPVIRFADGSWLVEPSATQLQAKCKELGLI